MASTFIYQHTDFPQQTCSPAILARHIREAGYAVTLTGANRKPIQPGPGFTVTLKFSGDLQPAEETDLNAQVAFHDPADPAQIPPSGHPPEEIAPEDYDAWGDDVRDDGASIQAAMTAASAMGGGVVTLRPSATYRLSATLIIPTRVMLKIPNLARLRMMADADVISMQAGSVLDHRGEIDCQAPGYTSSAILLDGIQRFNLGDGTAILGGGVLRGRTDAPPPTGRGLYMHAHTNPNDHVAWVDIDLAIIGFGDGVHLHAEVPSSGNAYVTANNIKARIANCVRFFHLEGGGRASNNAVNGNTFRGKTQTHVGQPYAERALLANGGWLNDFNLLVSDWGGGDTADLRAIEFTKVASNNRLLCNVDPRFIIDESVGGEGQNRIEVLNRWAPRVIGMASPPGIDHPTFLGDQNDMLAAATQRYTVTESVAPSSGLVRDAFSISPNVGPRWNAPAGPVTIEIDFGGPISGCYAFGCAFGTPLIPKSVDLEYENGGQWTALHSTTTNARREIMGYFGSAGVSGTTKVRLTISDPDASDLWLTRLYMFASSRPGRAFVPQERFIWAETPGPVDPGTIQPGATAVVNIPTPWAEVIDAVSGIAVAPGGFDIALVATATINGSENTSLRIRNTGTVPVAAPVGIYSVVIYKRPLPG